MNLARKVVIAVAVSVVTLGSAQAAQIGVAPATLKFGPDLGNPASPSPTANQADLIAARNEFEAFQIVLVAPSAKNLTITGIDKPVLKAGSKPEIPADAIRVYFEAPVTLQFESNPEGLALAGSVGFPSEWPDRLFPITGETVPALNRFNNWGATTSTTSVAAPVISAGKRGVLFVEVHVPTNTPAATYSTAGASGGSPLVIHYREGADPETTTSIGINLTVWDWSMPLTSTLPSIVRANLDSDPTGNNGPHLGICNAHGDVDANGQWCVAGNPSFQRWHRLYGRFLLDHRLSLALVDAVAGGETPSDWMPQKKAFDDAYGQLINGGDPLLRLRDPLNTSPSGTARMTMIDYPWWKHETPDASCTFTTSNKFVDQQLWMDTWSNWADSAYPAPLKVEYQSEGPDEPENPNNRCGWEYVQRMADVAHNATPQIKTIVTATAPYLLSKSATGVEVDILAPVLDYIDHPNPGAKDSNGNSLYGNQFDRPTYAQFLGQGGRSIWGYQSCDQHGCNTNQAQYANNQPNLMVDATAMQNRAEPWMHFIYGPNANHVTGKPYRHMEGLLYFNVALRIADAQSPGGLMNEGGNGDGTLLYAGTYPTVGTDTPIASFRLKMLREGLEDWEYLYRCEQSDPETAMSIARSLFPMRTNPNPAPLSPMTETGSMYAVNNYGNSANPTPEEFAERLAEAKFQLIECINGAAIKIPNPDWLPNNDTDYVSPPRVNSPIEICGTSGQATIRVSDVVPGSWVELSSPGWSSPLTMQATDPFVEFSGVSVSAGQTLFATQTYGTFTSDLSAAAKVVTANGPPKPTLGNPFLAANFWACAKHAAIWGPYSNLWVKATLAQGSRSVQKYVGQYASSKDFFAPKPPNNTNIITPLPLQAGVDLEATLEACQITEKATPVHVYTYTDPKTGSSHLPIPFLQDCPDTYGSSSVCVLASGLVPGAALVFDIFPLNGTPWSATEYASDSVGRFAFSAPPGSSITVRQELCGGGVDESLTTDRFTPTVKSCDDLPAPRIKTPQAQDENVEVIEKLPGARIHVFAGSFATPEELADGYGQILGLSRPLQSFENLFVLQSYGVCNGYSYYPISALPAGSGG